MTTSVTAILLLSWSTASVAGTRKETVDEARAAIEGALDQGPAASAAEIPALSKLLDKAGWIPTPELSGVFRPGSVFMVEGGSHALLASDCVGSEPQENTYTSAEMVSSMQAGVSVRAGLGSGGVSGELVKKVKFGTPVQQSVPVIDLQITAECFPRLEALPEATRASAYVVRELLRAEIAEQTCGRLNAEGRIVGLGSADAAMAAACAQASLEPVGVGYRTVPLDEVLAKGPAPSPAAAPETETETVSDSVAAPVAAVEPPSNGPLAVVFTEGDGSCEWNVEDLATGNRAFLSTSAQCPDSLMWKGQEELFHVEGDALYMLRAGSLRAERVKRPSDPQCDDGGNHPYFNPGGGWDELRLDRKTGELRWACWVSAHTVEDLPGGSRKRVCAGEVCAEDDFPNPDMLYKDYEFRPGSGWEHADTHVDCMEGDGCGRMTWGADAPLAPATELVEGGGVTMGMIKRLHADRAVAGCEDLPEELQYDPILDSLLRTGEHFSSPHGESKEYAGCPLVGAGFAFWVRYFPDMTMPSQNVVGPVLLCDATCRRKKVVDLPTTGHLIIQSEGTWVVAGPDAEGRMTLLDGVALEQSRRWEPNEKVLVLPSGVVPPLGVRP